jgi:hypothetical protein
VEKKVRVLSCEDLLLFKAATGRLIDLADIQTLYALQGSSLDLAYLEEKAAELGLKSRFWLSV